VTREGSAGQSGERTAAVGTTVDLCAPPVTAVLDGIREITIRTEAP
jgi:hypothetical protein